jgi:hypothetical protein
MYQNPISPTRYVFWFFYFLVLIGMILVLSLVEDAKHNISYVLVRSIAATILLFLVVNPLFRIFVKRGAKKSKNIQLVKDITQDFIQFRMDYKFSLFCTQEGSFFFMRYIKAMEFMIALRLESQKTDHLNSN